MSTCIDTNLSEMDNPGSKSDMLFECNTEQRQSVEQRDRFCTKALSEEIPPFAQSSIMDRSDNTILVDVTTHSSRPNPLYMEIPTEFAAKPSVEFMHSLL